MDLAQIRRLIVTALFSDDRLLDFLVLKGGNALELVYGIVTRGSVDLDFSMAADFADLEEARDRLFAALRGHMHDAGFVVFDEALEEKPAVLRDDQPTWWGGYLLTFKLIEKRKYEELDGDLEGIRRNAQAVDPKQRRTFKVDISKFEFCDGKIEQELDDYLISAYTPEMIAIEKVRAVCQQMPDYSHISSGLKRARARDFYDVHEIIEVRSLNLLSEGNLELWRAIFAAKEVPIHLLSKIRSQCDFHRPDWPALESVVQGDLRPFDFYVDYVADLAEAVLEALRKE